MKKYFVLIFLFVVPFQAFAADGSSGCGPGWYVFKDNSLVSSSLRTTTNVVLFPAVTIGMTFGTSNCTKHSIVKKEQESLYFIVQNYYELKGQTATGSGEYLSALTHTLGCPMSAAKPLSHKMKVNYEKIFNQSTVNAEKTLLEIYNTIFSDKQLTSMCLSDIA